MTWSVAAALFGVVLFLGGAFVLHPAAGVAALGLILIVAGLLIDFEE